MSSDARQYIVPPIPAKIRSTAAHPRHRRLRPPASPTTVATSNSGICVSVSEQSRVLPRGAPAPEHKPDEHRCANIRAANEGLPRHRDSRGRADCAFHIQYARDYPCGRLDSLGTSSRQPANTCRNSPSERTMPHHISRSPTGCGVAGARLLRHFLDRRHPERPAIYVG